MNNTTKEVILYFPAMMVVMVYSFLKDKTEWLWTLPFLMICLIMFDWAILKIKFANQKETAEVKE